MAVVSPQLFPYQLPEEMIPRDVFTCAPVSRFYILDCQDISNVRGINDLARLFFEDKFVHCLVKGNGISSSQVISHFGDYTGPPLNEKGRIPSDTLKTLHVIGTESLGKLADRGGICPCCNKEVRILISCPLWEKKLEYPNRDIDWSIEERRLAFPTERTIPIKRSRSLSGSNEFSLLHLVFLIEMAYLNFDPQVDSIPEGIITKFLSNDREYATEVLDSIRNELFIRKARGWIQHLKERSDLLKLRRDLFNFLETHKFPTNYSPQAYSQQFFTHFERVSLLEEIKIECCLLRSSVPIMRPMSPGVKGQSATVSDGRCLPIRYLLLGALFIFTFLYFLSTILITFVKGRFFFGEDL